jgi:hypothetical protein
MAIFAELASIFGSKTKAQEILLLLKNRKEIVRQGFYEEELHKVESFCRENFLFLVRSRFKVLLDDFDDDSGNYSNRGLRVPETDPRRGMYFVYISKDEGAAWQASFHEQTEHHQKLGWILGYPPCCVEYFCRNFSASNPNPIHDDPDPYLDLSKREQDLVLISHFPCSSECAESLAIAKSNLELLERAAPKRAEELKRGLKIE